MTEREFQAYEGFSVEFLPNSHRYFIEHAISDEDRLRGELPERKPAISVTSALSILDKPALRRWQGNEDATAVLGLERDGELRGVPTDKAIYVARERGYGAEALRDKGGARGTAVHEALRLWCAGGAIPNLSDYPDETRGYVQAMCDFLVVEQPEVELAERIVGSPQWGYAGRLDLIATVNGIRGCWDLKTGANAGLYREAHTQLAGYCATFPECGIEPVEETWVLELREDGSWVPRKGIGTAEQWFAVLDAHKAMKKLDKGLAEAKKVAA